MVQIHVGQPTCSSPLASSTRSPAVSPCYAKRLFDQVQVCQILWSLYRLLTFLNQFQGHHGNFFPVKLHPSRFSELRREALQTGHGEYKIDQGSVRKLDNGIAE